MSSSSNMYPSTDPSPSYDPSFDPTLLRRGRRSRPMSWHPAGHTTPNYMPPSTTASMNLSAMALPQQMNDDPLFYTDDMILPSTSYSLSGLPLSDEPLSTMAPFLPMDDGSQVEPSAWDGSVPDLSTTSHLSDAWSFDMMSMNNNMPSLDATSGYDSVPSSGEVTGPPTPDLLPMQPFEPETQEDEDELVGMGLYNQPESFNGSVLGKGLKLEETFTPSSPNNTKDGEDDDEEANNDQSVQRTPEQPQYYEPLKNPVKPDMNLLSQSFLFDDDSSFDQHIITDTQPFFSLEQSCMNYGYGWI